MSVRALVLVLVLALVLVLVPTRARARRVRDLRVYILYTRERAYAREAGESSPQDLQAPGSRSQARGPGCAVRAGGSARLELTEPGRNGDVRQGGSCAWR